jgi:hypothetical protein
MAYGGTMDHDEGWQESMAKRDEKGRHVKFEGVWHPTATS